jgi:hypothetical protein
MNIIMRNSAFIAGVLLLLTFGCNNARKEGWKDLFDGKTLAGWRLIDQDWRENSNKPDFYVQNGTIICNTILNSDGGYLVTEKDYSDFILELDFVCDSSLNSGVQCRGQIWEKDTVTYSFNGIKRPFKWRAGYVWGYQVEIDPSKRAWTGGLYEPGNRGWLVTLKDKPEAQKAYKPLQWNHLKIKMEGDKIQTWLNGIAVVDTTDNMSGSGFIGLQFHGVGKAWQENKKVMFKNIIIKEL